MRGFFSGSGELLDHLRGSDAVAGRIPWDSQVIPFGHQTSQNTRIDIDLKGRSSLKCGFSGVLSVVKSSTMSSPSLQIAPLPEAAVLLRYGLG